MMLSGFNPDGCTLLPIVRELIMRAHLADERDPRLSDYQPVWVPDLPIGPAGFRAAHDCTKMAPNLRGVRNKPKVSAEFMDVEGRLFVMSASPEAVHQVYIAKCHTCKSVFYSSAWDRTDTVQQYANTLAAAAKAAARKSRRKKGGS